VQSSQLWII